MRPIRLLPLAVLLLLIAAACQSLPREDLVLHYDRPAVFFEEALPIGNGRMGAMIYGGTDREQISLNDITLWTGEPDRGDRHPDILSGIGTESRATLPLVREALEREDYAEADRLQRKMQGHYSETYQPLGKLLIEHPAGGEITHYQRCLDIAKATASVEYLRDGKSYKADYYASAPDSAILIVIESQAPSSLRLGFATELPSESTVSGKSIVCDGYAAWHAYPGYYHDADQQFLYDPGRGIHFRTIVSVCSTDGSLSIDGGILCLEGFHRTVISIVNATSFNGFDKDPVLEGKPYKQLADRRAHDVAERSPAALRLRHEKDYRKLFDGVELFLGRTSPDIKALPTDLQLKRYTDLDEDNPELEALYFQYGRYLLIASSRTSGVPANLQGLWNESVDPPWSCNYTININLEENYWAAETTGLGSLHENLLDFIGNLACTGRHSAQKYYGVERGWNAAHNSDIWAMSCPVGMGSGDPSWANWTMGGAWLSTHIWEHWLYGRDRKRLEHDYPALKGAAEFCLDWLVEKEGELITSPCTSPENLYVTGEGYIGETLYGGTADLAIIRECLSDAVAAARELGTDNEFIEEAERALANLHPYKVGEAGNLQEWYHDWKDPYPQHRHQSHLTGVYPGHQITDGPLAEAALKTLETKGFETTGWSCGWRINLYARLGDGEKAYKMYRRLLRYVSPDNYKGEDARRGGGTYPNLLDAHAPFQIDGNFGGCAGVVEMLLHSHSDGSFETLPALPAAWRNGYVKGLRTRSGKTVDLEWAEGRLQSIKVK
ncbi:MAG: glycoside hydrolase family 95 protein [Bacteroidales bacterium]|nr:glycoside hydrolase family 95 protein [Bacteroidales bacterium]